MPHGARSTISRAARHPEEEQVRVVAPHVGGALRWQGRCPAEHRRGQRRPQRLDRAVRWTETRSRGLSCRCTVAARCSSPSSVSPATGRHRASGAGVGDAGAYAGLAARSSVGPPRSMAHGVYRIPKLAFDSLAVLTNTTPMGAFRGAGRPEAAAMLERLVDLAADELGLDPVELRRRNFIQPDEFPYETSPAPRTTPATSTWRSARSCASAATTLCGPSSVDAGYPATAIQLGIGLATYVEVTGGGGLASSARWTSTPTARHGPVGTSAHGQGHATTFSMVVADKLGVPMERVRFVQSDTAAVPRGQGTGGSRSLQLGGSALGAAADLVVEQARELAARLLEAPSSDIELADDGFQVAGVPTATVSWAEIAERAADEEARWCRPRLQGQAGDVPLRCARRGRRGRHGDRAWSRRAPLRGRRLRTHRQPAHRRRASSTAAPHRVSRRRCGRSSSTTRTATRDGDPSPTTRSRPPPSCPTSSLNTETPTPLNPLGAKGIGESATIGSTPAVQNAVVDALSHLGVSHVDMPCTPRTGLEGDPGRRRRPGRPVARAAGRLRLPALARHHRRRRRSRQHLSWCCRRSSPPAVGLLRRLPGRRSS